MRKILLLLIMPVSFCAQAGECPSDHKVKETLDKLNQACSVVREQKIAPLRAKYIEECVQESDKGREYCERFYKNYGGRMGNRPPLFMDLPECVKAWEFQKKCKVRK